MGCFFYFTLRSLSTYPYDSYTIALLDGYMEWSVLAVFTQYIYLDTSQSSPAPKWQRIQRHPICIAWRVPRMRLKDSSINPPLLFPTPIIVTKTSNDSYNTVLPQMYCLMRVMVMKDTPPHPQSKVRAFWPTNIILLKLQQRYLYIFFFKHKIDC